MSSPVDIETLFNTGRYHEALDSLHTIGARRRLTASEQVLMAQLLSNVGSWGSAQSLALQLIAQGGLPDRLLSRTHGTLARCYFRMGSTGKAIDEFRTAIEAAEQADDATEECWLRLQLFLNQVQWLGPHQADSNLSVLRRKVYQVGDPSLAVEFQLGLVQLAAKLALFPTARKHLETARALLPRIVDLGTRSRFVHAEVALAAAEGDLVKALESGFAVDNDPSFATSKSHLNILLAHICVLQSRFEDAEKMLKRGFDELGTVGPTLEVALRDTMMLLRLAQGNLDEVERLSYSVDDLLARHKLSQSYFGLWYLVTKIKWLYRAQKTKAGLEIALNSMQSIEQMADRNLWSRMQLLIAEGLGYQGKYEEGVSTVAKLFDTTEVLPADVVAESFRVIGSLLNRDNFLVASSYYSRAKAIFCATGNMSGSQSIDLEQLDQRESKTPTDPADAPTDVAALAETFAALLDTTTYPKLLAVQVFSLVKASNALDYAVLWEVDAKDDRITLDETRPEGIHSRGPKTTKVVSIVFSTHSDRRYEIQAVPRPDVRSRAALLTFQRIAAKVSSLARAQSQHDEAQLWPQQTAEHQLGLICSSERMLDLIKTIRRVATSNVTVLLTGETGVGKELFARALHQASPRSDKVFLPFNCGTVPKDLIDSQLFGHRRGAFTGAHADAAGVIRSAAGGTLFLDEIGEMAIETQPKLLRFLEANEILPLGETKPQLVDVRIVAATNANLDEMVADGRFREDLYYRLNVIRINIPPLRERREEIPALVEHFLERFGRELQKPMLRVADETLEYLVLYRWPGNVRQLANELRRMVALSEPNAVLMPAHLSDDIVASRKTIPVNNPPRGFSEVVTRIDQPLSAAVEHIERAAIQRALSVSDGNLIEAAKMLGLSRKGLYLKRQRLGLG